MRQFSEFKEKESWQETSPSMRGDHSALTFTWKCFGITLLTVCCVLFISSQYLNRTSFQYPNLISFQHTNLLKEAANEEFKSMRKHGYLIDSDICHIPDLDPFHPTVRKYIKPEKPIDCSKYGLLLTYTDEHTLFLNATYLVQNGSISCCYKEFHRIDGESDNQFRYSNKCIKFNDSVVIKDEFIKVECFSNGSLCYQNFHSFVHNKKQVEERCNKINDQLKTSHSSKYDVLIIGIDAMSRINAHRQLKMTIQFLKDKLNAVEMYGFNKVGDNTFPNVVPMLAGYHESELSHICFNSSKHEFLDKCNFLWKQFADLGYRTLYAEDAPHISTFNYLKKGFSQQPTDYYFRNFILPFEDALGWNKPLNCYLCLGSTSVVEVVLDWLNKFISHFHDKPSFAFAWINSLTHDFLNLGSAGDHLYRNFFETLYDRKLLNKTIVILVGDHGMRWGAIRETYIGRLEERLPMLFISLPPSFEKEHPSAANNLKRNSERLITHFDLYATMMHILKFNGQPQFNTTSIPEWIIAKFAKRGISLFESIPRNRSCREADIQEHFCTCEEWTEVNTSITEVIHTAEFLVNTINTNLRHFNQCSELNLDNIINARERAPSSNVKTKSDFDIYDYSVTISTHPGNSTFEGSVRFSRHNHTHELLGNISRINLYGKKSWCVDDAHLKKFCYCKEQIM